MHNFVIQFKKGCLILLLLSANGCSYLVSSATDDFGNNLKQAMLNSSDPVMVAEAIPAYLMLQEALLVGDPDNESMLVSTANLYSSYNTLTDKIDRARKQALAQKAFDHVLHAACLHKNDFCLLNEKKFDDVTTIIGQTDNNDLDTLYSLAKHWTHWIQANSTDWNAIAQLAQAKYIMNHVTTLQEDYKKGEAFLYLGVMESVVPPALGGKPDLVKSHFEKAMQLSSNNLMINVLYAKHYARMMFDRELHDALLNKVVGTSAEKKGLVLSNTLAKKQAKELLKSADDYF